MQCSNFRQQITPQVITSLECCFQEAFQSAEGKQVHLSCITTAFPISHTAYMFSACAVWSGRPMDSQVVAAYSHYDTLALTSCRVRSDLTFDFALSNCRLLLTNALQRTCPAQVSKFAQVKQWLVSVSCHSWEKDECSSASTAHSIDDPSYFCRPIPDLQQRSDCGSHNPFPNLKGESFHVRAAQSVGSKIKNAGCCHKSHWSQVRHCKRWEAWS